MDGLEAEICKDRYSGRVKNALLQGSAADGPRWESRLERQTCDKEKQQDCSVKEGWHAQDLSQIRLAVRLGLAVMPSLFGVCFGFSTMLYDKSWLELGHSRGAVRKSDSRLRGVVSLDVRR